MMKHNIKKEVFITIYERMLSESHKLEKQINFLDDQLAACPDGKLICSRTENRYKWYQSDGHTKTYIPKKNRTHAEQLAAKKYLTLLKEDFLNEKHAIDSYLKHHKSNVGKAEKLLSEPSEFQNLLRTYFTPLSQELEDWINAPYEKSQKNPEHLKHHSISGHLLRSKSEAIIDMILHINKIPYRYECSLHLGEITLFPDFTIKHPKTGEIFYWEHFGLMDDSNYSKTVCSKLQLYMSHGIIPSINLITTFETQNKPFNPDTAEKIIEEYFQ